MEKFTADKIVTINVDVQHDFCPGGSLAVTEGDQVVAPLNELNEYTRAQDGTVVFTGDQHPAQTPHFEQWPVHCVAGTEGATFHPDLRILPEDIVVDKGTGQEDGYSGFEGRTQDGRSLESLITPEKRQRVAVLIGGLATDYCVLNTTLDALKVDPGEGTIRVMALRNAMRAVNINPDDGDNAIEQMREAGATIVDTEDILTQRALELAQ